MSNFSIESVLRNARDIPDVHLLLAHVLSVSREFLFAYPEQEIPAKMIPQLEKLFAARCEGVPLAYLTGKCEFWSLDFCVTRQTLLPRPETELLVEKTLACFSFFQDKKIRIADPGTGAGVIAIALAHERPCWEIHASDISLSALSVAKKNAARLLSDKKIFFHAGDWLHALPCELRFDAIVANPPYLAANDTHLAMLGYEPKCALVAGESGLESIQKIAATAGFYLKSNGMLLLEHGWNQGNAVRDIFLRTGFQCIKTYLDLAGLERATSGILFL